MNYIGDFPEDFATVSILFTTHAASGAAVAPSTGFEAADVKIYKNGNGAEKTTTNGLTMTSPFDSVTGLHCLVIDTSNDTGDGGFWVAGAQYTVVLSPDETVDSLAVVKVIGSFGLALAPVFARVGAPVGASISADVAGVQSDTNDIQTRLPAALVSGRIDASVGAMAADVMTAAAAAGDLTTELQSGLATAASIAALNNLSAAQVNAEVDTAIADAALATAANLATVAGYIDTEIGTIISNLATVDTVVDAIKVTTDKLDDTVEDDGGTFRFTANALEQAPTGGTAPTVGQIADEVQTRTIAAVTLVNGLAANSVTAAVLASDAVTEIQTGLATASALSTVQTSVDDLPTNAELATALAGADDPVLAQVALVRSKTDNLPDDPADQSLVIAATNAIMAAVGDVPTNAELATALAAADDAVLAAIAALTIPTANANAAAMLAAAYEGAETFQEFLRLTRAALLGKANGLAGTTVHYRDAADTKDRILATVDANGNRTAVTVDAS